MDLRRSTSIHQPPLIPQTYMTSYDAAPGGYLHYGHPSTPVYMGPPLSSYDMPYPPSYWGPGPYMSAPPPPPTYSYPAPPPLPFPIMQNDYFPRNSVPVEFHEVSGPNMDKLRETRARLEQQLAEEQKAREIAVANAKQDQDRSAEEIRLLRKDLERARMENKALRKKAGNCAIL